MDPQRITELASLLRQNGDKILSSECSLKLSGSLLRALNDSFTLITDTIESGLQNGFGGLQNNFQVVKPNNSKSPVFRDLQLIYDFVQKTTLLRIVQYPTEEPFTGFINISQFRSLQRLEVQKTHIKQVIGIQGLRSQLKELICIKALNDIDEVIAHCGGDNSNGFLWNELKMADFSYNRLKCIDSALQFAKYLQHLNLRHNELVSASAIKWLPHLKILDLSYNCLTSIPQLHLEANKHLQILNLSNNCVEDLMNLTKLEALTELDLSDNCLLDHTTLLPISALITLRYLNLVGNPLHCHPRHRLAAAQFLHKNTATVKFVLDDELLSKQEKTKTGTHQLRAVGSLNSFTATSSLKTSKTASLTSSVMNTPSSSFDSRSSYRYPETTDGEQQQALGAVARANDLMTASVRKRNAKMRTVEIEEHPEETEIPTTSNTNSINLGEKVPLETSAILGQTESKEVLPTTTSTVSGMLNNNNEHLASQMESDALREKHGANWLQFRQTPVKNEQHHSTDVLGISRKLFDDFISTPISTNSSTTPTLPDVSPIEKLKYNEELENQDTSLYESARESQPRSISDVSTSPQGEMREVNENENVRDVYNGIAFVDEPEVSEPEDDEATYIVYNSIKPKVVIFLTISSNFVREKDAITQHTMTKWSLKILESCERLRANTLRINFDTVKVDKRERVYIVEEDLCQELERSLRNILAQRNLTEMNQIMYRCVNCSCEFSQETKIYKQSFENNEVRCPTCKSNFVAKTQEIPQQVVLPPVIEDDINLSPASIVEVSPIVDISPIAEANDTNSIGSATSLNEESSSCSKITNSQSSFDSNQSVVGSSNTDREHDFKSTAESEVEIISNPSISSIEVLDQNLYPASRKTSEERRTFFTPNLPTIDDHSFTQSCIERYYVPSVTSDNGSVTECEVKTTNDINMDMEKETLKSRHKKSLKSTINQFILTESSSSGSVTDSVCTAYEQQHANKLDIVDLTQNLISTEAHHTSSSSSSNKNNKKNIQRSPSNTSNKQKKDKTITSKDSDVSSPFTALLQSTNNLITQPIENYIEKCQPYKFNYKDFNDVDHRLKLYMFQNKFESENENIKWIVKGRIFNANTKIHWPGVLVISTCKCYVFEAFANEQDDVVKWLRQIVSVTIDRLESIQLLPWKLGLSFNLRDWGNFLILLQDILRTDSLLLYLENDGLPTQCKVNYQPDQQIIQQLAGAVRNEQLSMCALINNCIVNCDNSKRTFHVVCILTTATHLYLTSENLNWLDDPTNNEIELCLTQLMDNLVEVKIISPQVLAFNFLDETVNKCELWTCSFETQENAESCLNAISQSWQEMFGVPLLSA